MMNLAPWLCWLLPLIGAPLTLVSARFSSRLRDFIAISFSFLALVMSMLLIPNLINRVYYDEGMAWISVPYLKPIGIGMLIDPLSIILANVVAFISFLIMVYSLRYMHGETGVTRYWFMMNLFIGGMLLLVLADNFILFFVGWKIVGFGSYALIGHYYRDEREHCIGGPPPTDFYQPSHCGLKAWMMTTVGDVCLLAGMLLLFIYSGTLNFMELYRTTPNWMADVAATPGMLALICILLLGGPIGKSAQFPLHEWLPEAMAGPAPVSALIHAATMVKAGVYLVARLLPIFFFGYWIGGYSEAATFFVLAAGIGAFTAFLTGTQAMVSLELKKALAYSTMSHIGYMMLGLGVAGLSSGALVIGYTSGIFHLISHALFKAALFLCAGSVIHACRSIYMTDMGGIRREMPLTWFFMWVSALSLCGVPLLSGFWSKDAVLQSCLEAQNYWLFAIALITVAVTSFYSIRFMGAVFHGGKSENIVRLEREGVRVEKASYIMSIPYGILAVLTVGIGLVGPQFNSFLQSSFKTFFVENLHLIASETAVHSNPNTLHLLVPLASVGMILLGGIPAYILYVARRIDPSQMLRRHLSLGIVQSFLWNRWHIDRIYNRIFIDGMLWLRPGVQNLIENSIDLTLNMGVPSFFKIVYSNAKRTQTGILSYNMLYILIFIVAVFIGFLLVGI